MSEEWKIIDSKYIVQRPWLTARCDQVELPDGRIIPEYYVLEYPNWVNVIAITKDGRVVMEKQYRHGLGVESIEIPCNLYPSLASVFLSPCKRCFILGWHSEKNGT